MTENSPKTEYVTDTMGLVLWLEKRRMPAATKSIFQMAQENETIIHIPTMVFAELLYLSEKNRIGINLGTVEAYLGQ